MTGRGDARAGGASDGQGVARLEGRSVLAERRRRAGLGSLESDGGLRRAARDEGGDVRAEDRRDRGGSRSMLDVDARSEGGDVRAKNRRNRCGNKSRLSADARSEGSSICAKGRGGGSRSTGQRARRKLELRGVRTKTGGRDGADHSLGLGFDVEHFIDGEEISKGEHGCLLHGNNSIDGLGFLNVVSRRVNVRLVDKEVIN